MTNLLSEWIVEHGSAKITERHINFMRDKAAVLEKENTQLKEELDAANQEIDRLKQSLPVEAVRQPPKVADAELKILNMLFESNDAHYVDQISQCMSLSIGHTEHHLSQLEEQGLITPHYNMMDNTRYSINAAGRKYVVENP